MTMLLLAVLCGLVVVTVGQEETRRGCCAPRQWEGHINEEFSLNPPYADSRLILFELDIAFDSRNGKMRQDVRFLIDGVEPPVSFIYDYSQRHVYRINPDTKTCRTYSTRKRISRICIPRNARDLGSVYYGAGADKYTVNTYMFPQGDKYIAASTSRRGCIPVQDVVHSGFLYGYLIGNVGFANITAGIQDPSVFDVPSYCDQTNMAGNTFIEDLDEAPFNSFLIQHVNSRLLEDEAF